MLTKELINKYPDFESRKKALHRLIGKRGDYSSNLTKEERKEYEALCEWYDSSSYYQAVN